METREGQILEYPKCKLKINRHKAASINIRRRYLDAMYKRDERHRHLYITATRFLADELYDRGVRKLI
ncbi:MAG: hypothetical protein RQ885_13320 [Desulfurococcales archaeon]|nr:hypothetical protein [Desulfurococcales archaeon]